MHWNHLELVNLLIDSGYDVNHQDKEGKTPLHITFENHAPDLAQTLITQFKANTEVRDKQNWTPLHTAIDRGYYRYASELLQRFLHQDVDTEVSWIQLLAASYEENKQNVQFILDSGTDVNHVSSAGHTPLHIAVNKSNIDLVTLLLDQDVNIDSVTIDGKTPLHIAVDKNDEAIIQKLLAQNADTCLKDAPGNTSLHLAVRMKQGTRSEHVKVGASYRSPFPTSYQACSIQTVQAIIDHGADVNAVNNRGQTALWFACIDGQDSFVKILIDTGADPRILDKYGDSCLHAAIHGQCSTETIQKIIDHDVHVNAVNNDGATPLLLACSAAQAEAVNALLKAKANPNIAFADGDTSLHAAIAADCSIETIQEIIDNGAEVNVVNKTGRTALLFGCFYRQMDSVKVLLEAGADPSIADEEGFSCIHAAIDGYCSKDTLQALINHGTHIDATRKDGTNALLRACTTGQSESVMFLLGAGADVSITKPNDNSCLHEAVKGECSKEALQRLIAQGIDVNTLNKRGETALFLACLSAQAESLKMLLQNGADPNILNAKDYTGLHAAVYECCTNEALQEIIAHGVYLDVQNINGETALWLACSYQQQNSVNILLEAGSNPNIASTDKCTSLHAAVNGGCSKSIISAILNHGADVNVTNRKNVTALMLACEKLNKDAINVFLNVGADPNVTDTDDNTWLHYAARNYRCSEILQAIVSHGVDVNATNNKNATALLIACEKGNKNTINVLLNAGADPNITDDYGYTWLHYAAQNVRCTEVLQTVISHGVDVNATNKYNKTALIKACESGNTYAIDVLFNAGADPNISDEHGDTWLHYAARSYQSTEVLQAVISHGVGVNATNKNNETALIIACERGNKDDINVLLNAGADPNIAAADGGTCLHYVDQKFWYTCVEVLQAIISHGVDVNAPNKNNVTALMKAWENGNKEAINVLLNAGADPNITDFRGNTWLHYAAQNICCTEFLQTVISHGVDVNATNRRSETALMRACVNKNKVAINILLNAGADPKITNADGDTWLHYAAQSYSSTEVLQTVINHGVDVNATNKKSVTALMIACEKGNKDAINVLLNAGADPNITDADGDTWLHHAAQSYSSTKVTQAIISHGVGVNTANKKNVTALMRACESGNIDTIFVLLDAGSDPHATDVYGETWLHYAAQSYRSTKVILAMLIHGVDVNATHRKNVTALMIACEKGKEEFIDFLLNAGTDSSLTDDDGNTWLHYAARNVHCTEVLQTVISHGVDVNATNKNNVTALMITCEKGSEKAIDVLLNAGADRNLTDDYGNTCLHYAARNELCRQVFHVVGLSSHALDVNATNKKNVTALMIACKNDGDKDAINVLLNAGADPHIADADGDTCLHYAAQKFWCPVWYPFSYICTEVLQAIISPGVDVNATNKKNVTTLMITCEKGSKEAIDVLLNAGADPNIADTDGNTCLHYLEKKILVHLCRSPSDNN